MNISINKNILYVTGLPRSGSTLLCQLLDIHSQIYSTGHSSPLCQTLNQLRHNLSDNEFLLSQLDCDFNLGYQRLLNAYRGFINGWFAETDKPWVVDKNRGWLNQLDSVSLLNPDFRMLVCVREPAQIYGSIEARHQNTLLLDFPDHLAHLSRYARAEKLFASDGVIGGPMKAIEALQDEAETLQKRLFYVVFEDLMQDPQRVMQDIYRWLDLPSAAFNPQKLPVKAHESDSYYRFKYSHQTRTSLSPPQRHQISARIEADIQRLFVDFYQLFYPRVRQ
ncbi:sulfotransferase family protein [Candidatus Marithrix sp. Canyon 246]|uniref:sulfotransferase family protein n=1 Tax=Candidatus Marithrix sp. Canyon 246 TaxID=1827136 RepID=UPI000849EEBB|nr:sulfotransferase [Candidatus Marithrix sp. Canyon 246]